MTLKEIREDYVRYSSNVSELSRNLSYAGIGIIWLFKQSISNDSVQTTFMNSIPSELRLPLVLFVIALVIDILQYFLQTTIWYFYYLKNKSKRKQTNGVEDTINLQEPEWLNILPWLFWLGKFLLVIVAYFLIGCFLI